MNIKLLLIISLRSLSKHKGRSFLTILGIIIGIAAIIATLAIGKGAAEKTRQQFLAMGSNYVVIHAGNWLQEGKTSAKKRRKAPWLQDRDVDVIKRLCHHIRNISPEYSRRSVVSYRDNSLMVEVKGGNEDFLKILARKIKRGFFFNENHVKSGARVAILGSKSAKELFKALDPIDKIIKINDTYLRVIGVLKRMENYQGMRDPNFDILVPIKTLKRSILKETHPYLGSIVISAPNKEEIPLLVRSLKNVMRFRRKIKEGETDNFTVWDQASILKAAEAATSTIALLLLIIATISLIVGGIGIMNIMLVSVSERTREIGIRMALGANSKLILRQFLVEAVTLCLIGGMLGVLLGVSIPYGITRITNWTPIVTWTSIIVAFITTSIIGVFFGFYPAYKASRLRPVEALFEQ